MPVLILFLVNCTLVTSHEVITSLSGRDVPVHLVQQHFEKALSPSDHNKNIIYELTDQNVIQGPDLRIDLNADVRPSSKRSAPPRTVTVNGIPRAAPAVKLTTLKAKSYNIIIEDESRQVLSVTGDDFALAPLHKTEFPGIFVNKMAFSKRKINLSNDVRFIEEGQGLEGSSNINGHPLSTNDDLLIASKTSPGSFSDISARQAGSCASGTTHYLEIAVAYDNTFCALFGNQESAATQAVQNLIDDSNMAYGMTTCIQLALVHAEAHCNDPRDPYAAYTSLTANGILNAFQRLWVNSRTNVRRDAAYLITGFMDGTSTLGIAFVGVACRLRSAYGWVEGARTIVLAHEVGHTIGGNHTPTGIMRATLSSATQFTFSAQSAAEFANFVDNGGGSTCMGTSRPPGLPGGTSAPTTTTAAPTVAPGRQCAAGFNRNNALRCRNRRLVQINYTLGGEPVGRLRIILLQRNGRFTISYRTNDRLFIARSRDVVSTDENVVMDLGDYVTQTRTVRRVNSAHEAGDLAIPSGASTCCRQTLFIGASVQVCVEEAGNTLCQTAMDTYSAPILCSNVCRRNPSGVFTPASATVRCPTCV